VSLSRAGKSMCGSQVPALLIQERLLVLKAVNIAESPPGFPTDYTKFTEKKSLGVQYD
jgi:hypothetical protein